MKNANSSVASICESNRIERANRGFSWTACAITESFSKVLPKLLLIFTILIALPPSVYAGSYVPGTCAYGKDNPTDACVVTMGVGSMAHLTYQDQWSHQFFDCSNPHPDCTYPNTNLYDPRGPWYCWTANQMGINSSCLIAACPDHASGTPCVCDAGYKPDAAGTSCVPEQCSLPNVINATTGKCGPPPCTAIDAIPPLPTDDNDYACTQSLDKGAGVDVDKVCPPLNAKLPGEMQCFAKKLAALSPPIPYSGPSSTIRTEAYQNHLLDIWDEHKKLKKLTATEKQACAARIADVNDQMKHHHIKFAPSDKDDAAPHVQGIAFDIPSIVADTLKARATMSKVKTFFTTHFPGCISCQHIPLVTGDVQDYINSTAANPPACNLDWGGRFGDYVHFQLQHP